MSESDNLPKDRLNGRICRYRDRSNQRLEVPVRTQRETRVVKVLSDINTDLLKQYKLENQKNIYVFCAEGSRRWRPGTQVTFHLAVEEGRLVATEIKSVEYETEVRPLLEYIQMQINEGELEYDAEDVFKAFFRIGKDEVSLALPTFHDFFKIFDEIESRTENLFGPTLDSVLLSAPDYWKDPTTEFFQELPEKVKAGLNERREEEQQWERQRKKEQQQEEQRKEEQRREEQLFERHPGFKDALLGPIFKKLGVLVPRKIPLSRSRAEYSELSGEDVELALSWAVNGSDAEKAKMLSARYAELHVAEFYKSLGHDVEDVALHQITKKSDDWKTHDLVLDGTIPIDVKNARLAVNAKTFVQHTVKRFKKDRFGSDVKIVGVLSSYTTYEKMQSGEPYKSVEDIPLLHVLGETSIESISNLVTEFSRRNLKVEFGSSNSWPVWVFNQPVERFEGLEDTLKRFKKATSQLQPEEWNDLRDLPIPQFLLSKTPIPEAVKNRFLPWQVWFLDKLEKQVKEDGLTLPWLYLFTFQHFIDAMSRIESAESKKYSPEGYEDILYHYKDPQMFSIPRDDNQYPYPRADHFRPAGLHDPLRVIERLIATLHILWYQRHTAGIAGLSDFQLKGQGLLRARNQHNERVTVMAYCGGTISKVGRCGNFPLVIGEHETCTKCGMLVCDVCGHCSSTCNSSDREKARS